MTAEPDRAPGGDRDGGRVSVVARATAVAVERPWIVLGVAAVITAVALHFAAGLELRSNLEELLPGDIPSVAHIKEMVRRVGGDGSVLVVLENQGPEGLAASKKLAPVLAADLMALGPDHVRAVQWNVGAARSWFEDHWPLFASVEDLTRARDAVQAEVAKRVAEANPLLVDLLDDDAASPAVPSRAKGDAGDDAVARWLDPKQKLPRQLVAERFERYDDGFLVQPQKRALALDVRPAGTSLGVPEARALLDRMRQAIDRHRAELEAAHLRVGFGGSTPTFVAEYEAVTGDVFGAASLCFSLVILSLLLFFRDLRSTSSLGIAILAAVAITFGITRLTIGYLNTQTAFLGVIVAGNGINYGLIYLARVKQLRRAGVALVEACVEGARVSARATLLASVATSVSFGALVIAANRGFRHFGYIGGMGMLLCWLCTFALVPALLAIWEKARPYRADRGASPDRRREPGVPRALERAFARPGAVALAFAAATTLALFAFVRSLPVAMERNLDRLSNDPLQGPARRDNDLGQSCLGRSIAGTLALLDSRDEADTFCDRIRERMKAPARVQGAPPAAELIDGCSTLSDVLPRFQREKLALIAEIRAELTDKLLGRLSPTEAARLRAVRDNLAAQRELSAADAPADLLDPFRERDGQLGRLAVVTAKPGARLEDGPHLEAFVAAVRGVPVGGRLVDASGSNVIFSDLLKNIDAEGPRTTLLSFAGVCLLVLVYFRDLRTSAGVLATLFAGVALMAGGAATAGFKINFFNFIVFPITFGIAVDYGANIAARARERGVRALTSLAEVGPAVALCSWTSIIGYGSLLLSINRALRSFGAYGMLGEVMSIAAALVLLPALMVLQERRSAAQVAAGRSGVKSRDAA